MLLASFVLTCLCSFKAFLLIVCNFPEDTANREGQLYNLVCVPQCHIHMALEHLQGPKCFLISNLRELIRERRRLEECKKSLLCRKCSRDVLWLFFFLPHCNADLNSPLHSAAVSTIVLKASCWAQVREILQFWGGKGGSPVTFCASLPERGTTG